MGIERVKLIRSSDGSSTFGLSNFQSQSGVEVKQTVFVNAPSIAVSEG